MTEVTDVIEMNMGDLWTGDIGVISELTGIR